MQSSILSYTDDSNNVDRQNKTYLLSPNIPPVMFEWRAVWFGMEWPGGSLFFVKGTWQPGVNARGHVWRKPLSTKKIASL